MTDILTFKQDQRWSLNVLIVFSFHTVALELLSVLRWIYLIKKLCCFEYILFLNFQNETHCGFLNVSAGSAVVLHNLTCQLFINYKGFLCTNNASLNCLLNILWWFTTGKWYRNSSDYKYAWCTKQTWKHVWSVDVVKLISLCDGVHFLKVDTMKIASFNIRRMGPSKLSDKNIVKYLIKVSW